MDSDSKAGPFAIGAEKWSGLSKLVEECGEVLQVLGKLIATNGAIEHWDGTSLDRRLHDELADLIAAARFFAAVNGIDGPLSFGDRVKAKFELFTAWHNAQRQ